MTEFSTQAASLVKGLPANQAKPALTDQGNRLMALVAARADAKDVAAAAKALHGGLVHAYRIAVSPHRAPDVARGATLFVQQCSTCHGATGHGDGPAAKGMDPPPADFLDVARMDKRSAFGIYNTITLGVQGTPMRAFGELSDEDRWALAFYVASLPVTPELRSRGSEEWAAGHGRKEFAALDPIATLSPEETLERHGNEGARDTRLPSFASRGARRGAGVAARVRDAEEPCRAGCVSQG